MSMIVKQFTASNPAKLRLSMVCGEFGGRKRGGSDASGPLDTKL